MRLAWALFVGLRFDGTGATRIQPKKAFFPGRSGKIDNLDPARFAMPDTLFAQV